MNQQYDIVIVGAGMVGASLACSLADKNLKIAIIESKDPDQGKQNSKAADPRATALSEVSRRFYASISLWVDLVQYANAIKSIHVSTTRGLGVTELHHYHAKLPALGYVIENKYLMPALWQKVRSASNIDIYAPGQLEKFHVAGDKVRLTLSHQGNSKFLDTQLLVAADGMHSSIRRIWGIPSYDFDYRQSAIIGSLTVQRPRPTWAYERLTTDGPLALLPQTGNRYAMIWCMQPKDADKLLLLDEKAFLTKLRKQFGNRLGQFLSIGQRNCFPLKFSKAIQITKPRCILLGNAAHSLHPVAGQGLNLGLREVAHLAELLVEAKSKQRNIGGKLFLHRYSQYSNNDQNRTGLATHALVRCFSYHSLGIDLIRNGVMLAFDHFTPGKAFLCHQAMGGLKLPRLSRGIALP